jgi:peptidoglycan/xylan/chitin deacetylase (PgdA/CDA1 family)
LAGNFTEAIPLLEKFDAPAVFFVATQHVRDPQDWLPASRSLADQIWPDGRYDATAHALFDGMSEKQLFAASQHPLITIGSHTITHPFLTRCDDATLEHELVASRRYLEEVTGHPVDLFAYPTGDYDRRVAEAVRRAGYRAAFAETSRDMDLPAYEIPRVGLYRHDPAYLSFKLSGLHQPALKERYA